jgi:hypothetical protein
VEGFGPGHGHPDLLSSYQAELGGLLALLYLVYRISEYHGVHSGRVHIYCDNKSALQQITKVAPLGITPYFSSDYDLLELIRLYFNLLPISAVGERVKGHYTGDKREYKHDLNDRADYLATHAHHELPRTLRTVADSTPPPPPGYKVRLKNARGLITSKFYKIVSLAHHEQPLISYITKKANWSSATFHSADWDAHSRAFNRLTRFQCIGMAKIIHNQSNTNRQNRLLYGQSDPCPGCNQAEETFEHMLHCTHGATSSIRASLLATLETSLKAIATPPLVIEVIMGGFMDWLNPSFSPSQRSCPSTFGSIRPGDVLVTHAYTHQYNTIGWYQFCLGRISKRWEAAVQACLPPAAKLNGQQWGSLLITALWQFTRSMWRHRNELVHGADAAANAQRILTSLRDQVCQHYQAYQLDPGYVLSRHMHLFTSRSLERRLQMSYDYVTCWLQSVDEARQQLANHIETQRMAAIQFFGPPPRLKVQRDGLESGTSSDSEYIPSVPPDSISTSLHTQSTLPTTGTTGSFDDMSDGTFSTVSYEFSMSLDSDSESVLDESLGS